VLDLKAQELHPDVAIHGLGAAGGQAAPRHLRDREPGQAIAIVDPRSDRLLVVPTSRSAAAPPRRRWSISVRL